MKRNIWKGYIYEFGCQPYPCPICKSGVIVLDKSKKFEKSQTAASTRHQQYEFSSWVEIAYLFSCWGVCKNHSCKEVFTINGEGSVEEIPDEDHGIDHRDYFWPKNICPAPHIIDLPNDCPDAIEDAIVSSFSLFWVDVESCANKIRASIEALMDHLGIPGRAAKPTGGTRFVTLHERIGQMKGTPNERHVEPLLAIKWFGNSGTHLGVIGKDDLLDAYEILSHTLDEIIEKTGDRIAKLATAMTAKFDPSGKALPPEGA